MLPRARPRTRATAHARDRRTPAPTTHRDPDETMRMSPVIPAALLALAGARAAVAQGAFPSDSAVRGILRARVASGWTPGIVVGLIDSTGARRVIVEGSAGERRRPLGERTIFEIGSATKAFTGILLAEMAGRGEVRLDDPVATFLPDEVTVPSRGGTEITLLDLATHHSGLPRLPGNMRPASLANPYADYTVAQLHDFLSGYELPRDPGESYEYSNLAVGLLGHALARRADTTYEALLVQRVLAPLGMRDTRITLGAEQRARMAQGHDAEGKPVPAWDLPTLAGAGALRSTAADLLDFLAANLGIGGAPLPLRAAMTAAREPRRPAGNGGMRVGLGWHIMPRASRTIVWHNGGTGGFHSFVGFDPERRIGVVVLSNASSDIDDIALHLLDPASPLVASRSATVVAVSPAVLERYVGEYRLSPEFSITVTREGGALHARGTGQPRLRLLPASESEFLVRAVDARIVFERDSSGAVTGLVLHQGGRATAGRKVR
jgi:CubicO group peptidase (beta-lactamase class C family)